MDWEYVLDQIDAMLDCGEFAWAVETLEGISEVILERKFVSTNQRNAIDNIRDSRNWDPL